MENNERKEQWIDEVLASTTGMSRAQPDAGLYEKISYRLSSKETVNTRPLPVKRWVAAAILLLAVNIGSAIYFTSQGKQTANAAGENGATLEIQSVSTYNY